MVLAVDLSSYDKEDQAEVATWEKLIRSEAPVEVKGLDLFSAGAQILVTQVARCEAPRLDRREQGREH